ncbi:MAG: bifunctional metallophosphatase/5'-nucleotidase [Bacilli bacterium]
MKKKERFVIYHTNDVHSDWNNWFRIESFLAEQKACHAKRNETMFYFDCGDHLDRSDLVTEQTKGRYNVERLNIVCPDAVTLGNNEGVTFLQSDTTRFVQDAKFPVIVGNITPEVDHLFVPYHFMTTPAGNVMCVLGLTAPYEHMYHKLGYEVEEPMQWLERMIPQLAKQADLLVLLSHLGKDDDLKVAERWPEINLILGAHTHHFWEKGHTVGEVQLAACGYRGEAVGIIEVAVEESGLTFDVSTKSVAQLRIDEQGWAHYENQRERAQRAFEAPIITIPLDLQANPNVQTSFCDTFATMVDCQIACDVTLFHGGLFVQSLEAGSLSYLDIHHALPHKLNMAKVQMTGAQIGAFLTRWTDDEMCSRTFRGFGFCGSLFGSFWCYRGRNSITANDWDTVLERECLYTVVLPDFFAYSRFFPEIKAAGDYDILVGTMPKQLFLRYYGAEGM